MSVTATEPPAAPGAFTQLSHYRWAAPVWAAVVELGGAKTITLRRQLDVAAAPLERALERLDLLDLVVRNPGYGHPMRPEWVLGGLGRSLREAVVELVTRQGKADPDGRAWKKWTLPVLLAVREVGRFNEIAHVLPEASPRAITLALRDLVALG